MDKTIDALEVKQNFDRILDEVTTTHTPHVLTRDNRPLIVMISYEDYLKLRSREEAVARFNQTWAEIGEKNVRYSEAEVEADLKLATRELREQRSE
jgi:prevent-host-death family protein